LQVILWFTFSSASTPGVLQYYNFTDSTLDLLLAWGPLGGIVFQPVATALLSASPSTGFGLRASMRVAGTLSLLCAALRLLPSLLTDQRRRSHAGQSAVVLSIAQLLNAAAGPLLMSGCSTLAEVYFPPHRRGTATALAYSGGNTGQLLAFLIGPAAIDDCAANVRRGGYFEGL
jgi:nitrate/nitrite transporter NarK